MASSEDGYSEATDNIESPDTISTNKPNLPNKQNSSGSDKYNISNVLKHMYTLKYVQRQSVSPDKALEAVTAAAAPPSPFKATSTSKQFWMPDDQVKECFECNDKFTMFNRRHVNYFKPFNDPTFQPFLTHFNLALSSLWSNLLWQMFRL